MTRDERAYEVTFLEYVRHCLLYRALSCATHSGFERRHARFRSLAARVVRGEWVEAVVLRPRRHGIQVHADRRGGASRALELGDTLVHFSRVVERCARDDAQQRVALKHAGAALADAWRREHDPLVRECTAAVRDTVPRDSQLGVTRAPCVQRAREY